MYILINVSVNGVKTNVLVSKTKKKLIQYLKEKEYYWSAVNGRYIDDRTNNSGEDYIIQSIKELKWKN